MKECVSRRQIIGAAGVLTAGLTAGRLIAPGVALAKDGVTEKWPWPYEKLDPATTAELTYNEWYRVFCGGAIISAIFSQLREKVGEPYKSFPIDGFVFLEGGIAGWGTICGANSGANVVSNLIIGPRIAGPDCEAGQTVGTDIMEWYSKTAMPVFTPKEPKQPTALVQTTSDSPLCHISVGKWMSASGFELKSPERKDRCARVAASTAYKLVELLNDWKDGKYEMKSEWAPGKSHGITGQPNCTACHGKDVPTAPKPKA